MSFFKVGEITHQLFQQNSQLKNALVFYENEVASTNDWAKEMAFDEPVASASLSLFITDFQTKGRGRGEHSWSTPQSGSGFLSSWVFELSHPPSPVTSIRVGHAVYKSMSQTFAGLQLALKAPNDLYLDGKKVAGILIENLQLGKKNKLIIGIGLNVFNSPSLPESAAFQATHLHGNLKVSAEIWSTFMQKLLLELQSAAQNSNPALSAHEQTEVLHALNLNPNLSEKYISLEPDGSLVLTHSKIHWRDL